jgi:ATP-dependent DNA ligase
MALPFSPPVEPMLALAHDEIPVGSQWRYEPKWDGFRAIVFRDGDSVHLHSRGNKPLERYFPEVVTALKAALPERCIVDGEIIRAGPKGLDFEALQMRLHPAASRVAKLSAEIPASFVVFDLLATGDVDWRPKPFSERREGLLAQVQRTESVLVTPQTADAGVAGNWFVDFEGAGCDGVIARDASLPYAHGQRVMAKIKHGRTIDCVVGGFREGKTPGSVGALLLGLYDQTGVLHHVGHTSSFTAKEKKALFVQLSAMGQGPSFGQGRTPGAPSRWSSGKEAEWTPVPPTLVCEVRYDFVQGNRFRHAATFQRWREDKPADKCLMDQLLPPKPFSLDAIRALKV